MKTPKEFDYDLWTEEGRNMVRVKRTGEVCEVDADTMRMLRAEEKRLRRSMQGAPAVGSGERETVLSLDYVSADESGEMTPVWLEDPLNLEDSVFAKIFEREFISTLTPTQYELYVKCLCEGLSLSAYARKCDRSFSSIKDTRDAIRKKFKKFFGGTR